MLNYLDNTTWFKYYIDIIQCTHVYIGGSYGPLKWFGVLDPQSFFSFSVFFVNSSTNSIIGICAQFLGDF